MKKITAVIAFALTAFAFAAPAHAGDKPDAPHVVAFGDSITYGGGTDHPARESWPARIGAKRVAKEGAKLVGPKGAIHDYRRTVLHHEPKPDAVIVAYGMNDLIWSTTPEIIHGLRAIVRWNRRAGVETWVATLTPIGDAYPWGLQPFQAELNREIRRTFPGQVIDFDAALADPTGSLPPRYDSGDGLHPNAAAYARMAQFARRTMDGPW